MGTGQFEILEGDQVAASGKISLPEGSTSHVPDLDEDEAQKFPIEDKFTMTGAEVYKELRLRGYEYGPQFRLIFLIKIFNKSHTPCYTLKLFKMHLICLIFETLNRRI